MLPNVSAHITKGVYEGNRKCENSTFNSVLGACEYLAKVRPDEFKEREPNYNLGTIHFSQKVKGKWLHLASTFAELIK